MSSKVLLLPVFLALALLVSGCADERCPDCGGRGWISYQDWRGYNTQARCARCSGNGMVDGLDALMVRLYRRPYLTAVPLFIAVGAIWRALTRKNEAPSDEKPSTGTESPRPPSPPAPVSSGRAPTPSVPSDPGHQETTGVPQGRTADVQDSGTATAELVPVRCPGCGATYQVPSVRAGRAAKCKKCAAAFRIPTSGANDPGSHADSRPDAVPPPPPSLRPRRTPD